jgi:hypothetical protein
LAARLATEVVLVKRFSQPPLDRAVSAPGQEGCGHRHGGILRLPREPKADATNAGLQSTGVAASIVPAGTSEGAWPRGRSMR